MRSRSFAGVLLSVAFLAVPFGTSGGALAATGDADLLQVLRSYRNAMSDSNAPAADRFESTGTITGDGLSGSFHTWNDGQHERTDSNLGPRSGRALRVGDRFWYLDENGIARELTGVLARRSRTQAFIDSGDFASQPDRCALRGFTTVNGQNAAIVDVTAKDGDTETLYIATVTGLPVRVLYEDDDAQSYVDLSDWRTVGGHRFSFKAVTSDGDHEFDTTEVTSDVTVNKPIDAAVFVPLVGRTIAMNGPETIAVELREGHFYVPTRIGGRDYTFLLDSGAQNIVIDKHVASELGLNAFGELQASGAKRTGGLQIALIDQLAVGSGKLTNLVATTIDLHGSTQGAFKIDGILGYPFFASTVVKLDPAAKTITFGPPGSFVPAGEKLAIDTDRGFPEARLRANGIDGQFIVDTGNAAEVLLYKPFVDKHAGIVPFTLTTRNSYGIGGSTESYRTSLDELDVGNIPIYHAETDVMEATRGAFADRFDAGNVGLGVLKNFVITFDLSNFALYIARGPEFDDGRTRN